MSPPALRSRRRAPLLHLIALALAFPATACDSPIESTSLIRSAVVKPAATPLVRILDVRLARSGGVQVEYWTEGGPRLRVETEGAGTRHDLLLTRLRPDATYEYDVRPNDASGEDMAHQGSFTTAPLPPSIAVLDFTTEGTPTQPLTLFEITGHTDGFRGVVIVDDAGEVVWYAGDGPVAGTARRANGNFIILRGDVGVLEVTPAGEVVAEVAQQALPGRRLHHDAIVTPSNTVLFIAYDTRDFEGRDIAGEAIWEWDPDDGSLSRRWSSWNELSPDVDWGQHSRDDDWLHANSISLGPTGNIVMSFRFTDQVISIAPDFSHIEWRLGGINADVEVSGSDVFVGQHTAAELPSVSGRRRVLLFDNGVPSRGFSRAQELELDLEAGTATTVWEYRPTPDNFSFITSLAWRMPNGNTFVAFGAGPGVLQSVGPVEAFEVDPSGNVLFRVEVGGPTVNDSFVLYRARPIASIAGEEIVSD